MKKIQVPGKWVRDFAEEFDCSKEAVRMSLYYVFNSKQAKAIRKRAKELLLKEAEDVVI